MEDIVTAKAALVYYAKKPFEAVRDRRKEQQAESFMDDLIGFEDIGRVVSGEAISNEISEIKTFLDEILNVAPFSEVEIYFD